MEYEQDSIEESRCNVLFIRLTKTELAIIHAEAREKDLSVQAWAIQKLGFETRSHYSYRKESTNGKTKRFDVRKRIQPTLAKGDSEPSIPRGPSGCIALSEMPEHSANEVLPQNIIRGYRDNPIR
jgi:hypothetical protein